ncbi:MAG TPA: BTAD domain-containing putative transcriptional regulator [Actinoplanes sp.]
MRFYVLGSVVADCNGQHIEISRSQRRGLLGFLLLRHGTIVTAEALEEALWGGAPPATARRQVQTAVHAVRTALRQAGATDVLRHDGSGYLIQVEPGQLDLLDFHLALSRGRTAAADGNLVLAAEEFRAALELWRGPALTGASGAFVEAARDALADQRVDAIEDYVEVQLRRGLFSEVLATVSVPLQAHPLRERLQAQHIRALHGSGRQSEALDHYRRFRKRLADELGIDPGTELQELERDILRGAPAASRPSAAVVVPAMLPMDTVAFAGRKAELARLDELLSPAHATRATTIAVVAGTGGIGKTTLAIHWGHRRRDWFPDGHLYVDLRGYAPDRPLRTIEALARLLHAIGVPAPNIPAEPDQAAAEYRRLLLNRRMLIVLDNARDADQVRPLLPAGGGCAVIVTSRSRLSGMVAREGAQPVPLEPMSSTDSMALLSRALGHREVTAEPDAAAELVRWCGHVPLALTIAGANLRERNHRSISALLGELRGTDRLAALRIDDDEHTAMTKTIDLSYEALPQTARQTMRRLGLVPGADFTAAVVAGLLDCEISEAQRQLQRLTDYHLVREHAQDRYMFHDLLRLYATSKSLQTDPEEDREATTMRLAAFYLGHVDAAAKLIYPQMIRLVPPPELLAADASFDSPAEALAWLDAERTNLLAAIETFQNGHDARAAYLLADALRGYLHLRMNVVDWQRAATDGLRAAEATGDDAGQAAAWLSLASLRWRMGDQEAAFIGFEQALSFAQRAQWVDGLNGVLGNLGAAHRTAGRLDAAADLHRRGLEISRAEGRAHAVASHLGNLGVVYNEMGDLRKALSAYYEALSLFEEVGSRHGRNYALVNIGEISVRLGDFDVAEEYLARSRASAEELDDKAVLAGHQVATTALHLAFNRVGKAMECASYSLRLAREIGDRGMEVKALAARGAVMLARDAGEAALMDYEESAQVANNAGLPMDEVIALIGQAQAHLQLGDHLEAAAKATIAFTTATGRGYRLLARQAADLRRAGEERARLLARAGSAGRRPSRPEPTT